MTTAVPLSVEDDAALVALMEPIRRLATARGADSHTVDDVVQETLVRLMAQRGRLDEEALLPYALVTARNLVATAGRDIDRGRRHAHRLLDHDEPERPEDVALRREEERALTAALAGLSPEEREMLLRHEVAGEDTASIAAASSGTSGGVAARLARARAKLRVDFLLQMRRIQLPTARCRPVLLALSAGDRRRQHTLGAGRHLLTCATCTDLSQPLLERRRALAGLVPWLGLGGLTSALRARLQDRKTQVTTAAVVAGAAVLVSAAVVQPWANEFPGASRPATPTSIQPARASTAPTYLTTGSGKALLPLPGGRLSAYAGQEVIATGAPVQSVAADEGFWVGSSATDRVWVQLQVPGQGESGPRVRAGDRVSFRGVVVANPPGFADRVGVNAAEGAAQLQHQGAHLSVDGTVLQVR